MAESVNDPEALAEAIAVTVKDYRANEGVKITREHVIAWSNQFDPADRLVVLQETNAIMGKRYISRTDAVRWLGSVFDRIATEAGLSSAEQWLRATAFLDLQELGKSQKAMLALLDEILRERYSLGIADCGGEMPQRYLYLDDMLCTGNTAYHDLKSWYEERDSDGTPRIDRITPGRVIIMFVFAHLNNWYKLAARLRHWNRKAGVITMRYAIGVENEPTRDDAALDFAFPRANGHSSAVKQYVEELGVAPESLFRRDGFPQKEVLFTSPDARDQFEKAVLEKGLAMINLPGSRKPNIRPLGFTLPSHKNLGFGALAFTWRNVPNNSPLVFWYDSPIFAPLFSKRPPSDF